MTSSVARLEAATLAIREFEVDGDRIDALSFAIGELEALAQASVGAVDNPTLA